MAARRTKTKRGKALPLACRNAERLRDRKVELEHFLNQHRVVICFLSEMFRNLGQAIRLASYVCHRTDRQTSSSWRHSHTGPSWFSPALSCRSRLTHMQATAGWTVRFLTAHLSPPPCHWLEGTCLPVSAVVWRSCWPATWTLKMLTGTDG